MSMMNALLSPQVSHQIMARVNDLGYMVRDGCRVSGEQLGLQQSVPDNRKGDYFVRHFYMAFVSPYISECAFRLADQFYVTPNTKKLLNFDNLHALYRPGNLHTPAFANVPGFKLGAESKDIPAIVRKRILGTLVKKDSFPHVPDLVEQCDIPDLQAKITKTKNLAKRAQLQEELNYMKLWSHHFRRYINPKQYIDQFLIPSGKVQKQEVQLLKSQQRLIRTWLSLYNGINEAKVDKLGFPTYPKRARLYRTLKTFAKHEAYKNTPFMKDLKAANALASEEHLWKFIKGTSASEWMKGLWKEGFNTKKLAESQAFRNKYTTPDKFLEALYRDILSPRLKAKATRIAAKTGGVDLPKTLRLFEEFAQDKIKVESFNRVFRGSQMWLKLPLSILASFLIYGIIENTFDVKYLQPFQRKVVKDRGDAKDFERAGYMGMLPGIAAFAGISALPLQRSLGYFGSFALSGFVGLATWFASSTALFFNAISKPKTAKSKAAESPQETPKAPPANPPSTSRSKTPAMTQPPVIHSPSPAQRNAFTYNVPEQNYFIPNYPPAHSLVRTPYQIR